MTTSKGESPCCKCCLDFDIDPLHLVRPDLLNEAGREFIETHGIDDESLGELRKGAITVAGDKVKIFHRCAMLDLNGWCSIYETRPAICRAFECGTRADCALAKEQG